jgi:hypothetical protein
MGNKDTFVSVGFDSHLGTTAGTTTGTAATATSTGTTALSNT